MISGSLDEAFVSTPVVAADGRIFVSFLNTTDLTTGRDDYEVVEVSPSTGTACRCSGQGRDGDRRLRRTTRSRFGRQTYQDSLFRSWAAGQHRRRPDERDASGGRVVGHAEQHHARSEPTPTWRRRTPTSIVSQSFDDGPTWSAPVAIALTGDQFQPGAPTTRTDCSGSERSTGRSTRPITCTLLVVDGDEPRLADVHDDAGLTATQSDPTTGDRWFAATLNATFPFATSFLGDYSNIAIMPGRQRGGRVLDGHAQRRDLRRPYGPRRGCVLREDVLEVVVGGVGETPAPP